MRKPRWEKTIFQPTPDLRAILENPVESGPTIDIPNPAEPRPQDANMAGIKCDERGHMGHLAKNYPKKEPAVVQTVRVNPNELFCTSCHQSGHLDVICDQFPESAEEVRKKWDSHQEKLKADSEERSEESANPEILHGRVCLVRARNPRPTIVKCGNEQRCMFLEPKDQDALVSWEMYMAWRKTQEAEIADIDVRRQRREKTVKRIWWPETKKWLEVSSPVAMDLVLDGVHMKTQVAVVLQGQLKEGVVLGKQQHRCWSVKEMEEAIGVIDVDSGANVRLEFPTGSQSHVKLRGLLDTGAGLSLLSVEAWKRISAHDRYPIRNLPIQLVAANGLAIRTYGIVEDVELILAGFNLKANFILIDAVDDQDFILGRTFMRKYDILIDLRKLKLTIRDPYMENLEEPILQVGREPPVDVLLVDHEWLKTGETSLVKLQVQSEKCLNNRLMLLTQKNELLSGRLSLEDSVVRIGDDNFCCCSVTNRDSKKKLCLRKNLVIASATLVLEEHLIPDTLINQVVETDRKQVLQESESEFIDSSTEFLSGSECPLDDFSEFEREQQLDQALLKPIPKPDFSDVKANWGEKAGKVLENLMPGV